MARLLISVVVVAIAAVVVLGLVSGARRMVSSGRSRTAEPGRGVAVMKQTSFVLLVALIFYAAIWGAG